MDDGGKVLQIIWCEPDLELMLKEGIVSLQLLQPLGVMRAVCIQGVSFPLEGGDICIPQGLQPEWCMTVSEGTGCDGLKSAHMAVTARLISTIGVGHNAGQVSFLQPSIQEGKKGTQCLQKWATMATATCPSHQGDTKQGTPNKHIHS